nr:YbaK/EbsC family protein [Snodgrassella alvi]
MRTKTLFLTNRNNTIFYLLVMDAAKRMNFKKLTKLLGDKRIRFASADELKEKMRLPPA